MLDTTTLPLFDDQEAQFERMAAVDQLHSATNFFTVTSLVQDLLSRLNWPDCGGRMLDPAAGNGQFLVRAMEMLLDKGKVSDDEILDRIEGWEIHPEACQHARARVSETLMRHGRTFQCAIALASAIVHNEDFLTRAKVQGTVAVIATNPPFLRRAYVPQLLQDEYDEVVPDYALQDLLHAFLQRCGDAISTDGQIGIVTADRWLYAKGASILRQKLGAKLSIRYMTKLDSKSSFFRPKSRKANTPPRVNPVALVLGIGAGEALTKAPIYPSSTTTDYSRYPKLRDLATVRLAPWVGPDGIFLVTEEEAKDSGIPAEVLVPAIGAKDIVNDVLQPAKRFAIRTDPSAPPEGAISAHLDAHMHLMPESAREKRRLTPWVPPEAFHNTPLDQPTLLVKRICRNARAIRIPAGTLAIDHNLSITPNCAEMIGAIERALTAPIAQRWIEERARPLDGDFYELTAPMLRDLPIDLDAF